MMLNETQRQAILLAAINYAELYAEAIRLQALGASMDEQDDAFATADAHYRKLVGLLAVADPLGTRRESSRGQ